MASSYQLLRQESEEEDSAMAALMRSTDKEIEENCKLVRDVIKDRKKKRETIIKFKEVFEKSKQSMMKDLWGTGPTSVEFLR